MRVSHPSITGTLTEFARCAARADGYFAILEDAPLAQLAEQLTLNQRVVGSIPTRCRTSLVDRTNSVPAQRQNFLVKAT